MTVPEGVHSLYRRFRPGRFSEIKGQEHVVRALQGAVANQRSVHAYLFSGPRGTGKTSTARILAKALNCEHLVDGDPCNACASCVAITQGSSLDVVELDAASNNGVDDMRELAVNAWIGTSGHHKVYIIDEVHMLSKAASNALLKTLEEPPHGVVFVLATTDPHKVLDTIRSRTQHLEFRLINADVLGHILRGVVAAAQLNVDDATIDVAIQRAKGSARDALSALDQMVASGDHGSTRPNFDALFDALARTDAVAAFTSLGQLARDGWEPEQLAESFIAELRQSFLLLVAPESADAFGGERERLASWGQQLGLPTVVRVIETLGRCVRDMRSAPDATVVLEVTFARLTHPELDHGVAALEERVTRLERLASTPAARTVATPREATVSRPIGSLERSSSTPAAPRVSSEQPAAPASATPAREPEPVRVAPEPVAAPPAPVSAPSITSLEELREHFATDVVPRMSPVGRAVLAKSRLADFAGDQVTIAIPANMQASADRIDEAMRTRLSELCARPIKVTWAHDDAITEAPSRSSNTPPDDVELSDADLAESAVVSTDAQEHLIKGFFPGAEEIS